MAVTLTIETSERRVLVDGRPVKLRAKSFDVLALLASRPEHLFLKEVLLERVWRGRCVSPDVLTGCIREIRRTLGDRRQSPQWIETVPGAGYRLLRRPAPAVACDSQVAPPDVDAGLATDDDAASVAVSCLKVLSGGLDEVAQALSRDIAVGLARTRWLRIAASASVESLPGRSRPAIVGDALGVRYIVDGDVRRADAGFAVQVSLIEARSERILWAERFVGAGTDVASLLAEICAFVVAEVESEIERAEQERALISPVRRLDAWIGFHRSMNLLNRQNVAALNDAGSILREVASVDPTCARTAAARSWHCWQQLFFGIAGDRKKTLARARDFAEESIALDARDPLGHWALGRVDWLVGDMAASVVHLDRAVSLNPSFAIGHYGLGISLYMLGREAEAIAQCDAAIRLSPRDPMSFAFHCLKCQLLCFNGDFVGAMDHARQAASHPNVHAYGIALAAWVFELSGDRDAALECIAQVRRRWPEYSRSKYAAAMFHRTGWFPEDRRRAIDAAFGRLGF